MARIRSPNYPAISLPEAIDRVEAIHNKEQHLAAPREVMARHLGYNGINGASLKVLSALLKYGLLEKVEDDKRKVTELALRILHPHNREERVTAIREAAFRPSLFREFAEQWQNGVPSDENLKAYLMRRNFARDAIPEVIGSYRATLDLVTRESGDYTAPTPQPKGVGGSPMATPSPTHGGTVRSPQGGTFVPPSGGQPYSVTFTNAGIEVAGRITDQESADEFLRAISALKLLLRPADTIKAPVDDNENGESD